MFRNKWTILVVILVLAAIGLSACAQPTPEVVEKVVEVTVVSEVTKEVEKVVEQTVVVEKEVEKVVEVTPVPEAATEVVLDTNLRTEPPSLDPSTATDTTSIDLLRNLQIGLTQLTSDGDVLPMLATDWEMSEDGLEYTFHMRDDAEWVKYNTGTGEIEELRPVTAQDVVYGVRRTFDPRTASDYAYVAYIIKGGQELNNADVTAMSDEEVQALIDAVGVEALDDYTVKFTLAEPGGFFPGIASMWVVRPMPQETIEENGDRWTEPGFYWSNGPMVLAGWNHNSDVTLKKNPYWWGADDVKIDQINAIMVNEASTAFAMYEAGDLDHESPPLEQMDRIKSDPVLSEQLFIAPRDCTYYYGFTTDKPPVDNVLVRKALSAAIDREGLVEFVLKGGQIPANTFTPSMIFGSDAEDPEIAPWALTEEQGGTGYDAAVELAKGWLQEAGYNDGSELGTITLMYNTSEAHAQIAQAVAAMWKDALNVDVAVENQEWAVYLDTIDKNTPVEEMPHVWRFGWCADYPDANNWLNAVFAPDTGDNNIRWDNREYQDLIDQARLSGDPEERKALYKRAEMILNDEVAAIAPIYYYTTVQMTQPWVTSRTAGEMGGTSWFQWEIDWDAKKEAKGIN